MIHKTEEHKFVAFFMKKMDHVSRQFLKLICSQNGLNVIVLKNDVSIAFLQLFVYNISDI